MRKKIKDIISIYWAKANNENSFGPNWELLKYEIGQYFRKCGAQLVKAKKSGGVEVYLQHNQLIQQRPGLPNRGRKRIGSLSNDSRRTISPKSERCFC